MSKKDILLSKFIAINQGFALTNKSTNELDIYYLMPNSNSKMVFENYAKLDANEFEAFINEFIFYSYKLGTKLSQLQAINSNDEYQRFISRFLDNTRNSRIRFKEVIDVVYFKYSINNQINTIKSTLESLKKYQQSLEANPAQLFTSQKLQATNLLKSLDVKGRTDSQKLALIKDALSKMSYSLPEFNDSEAFNEELIESSSTNISNIISTSEDIVEEQPQHTISVSSSSAFISGNSYVAETSAPIQFRTTGTERQQIMQEAYRNIFGEEPDSGTYNPNDFDFEENSSDSSNDL